MAKHEIQIRPLQPHQLALIQAIEASSSEYPWSERQLADCLGHDYLIHTFSHTAQSELLGYWILQLVLDELHLLNFTISKPYQGRGLGSEILRTLTRSGAVNITGLQADADRIKQIDLEVRESNHAARRIYQKCGFEVIGMRKNYYPTQTQRRENALLMRCIISA